MTFEELMTNMQSLGIVKGNIEKRCGYYSGKLTELAKGRQVINEEHIANIANALEEMSEEVVLLAEEARTLDTRNIGQFCVYEFTFPNGKKYYGSTVNTSIRWKSGEGYNNQEVGKAIKEFGWDNVEKRIIAENLTKQNAGLIERTLIKATGSDIPGIGYNIY